MKESAVEKKRNSFSIDSIIAGNKAPETRGSSPAPRFDTRTYGPPAQIPHHSRSIPTDSRLSDVPSLRARTAAVPGMVYDEREVMRQRQFFDYGRYPNYDHAVAQFAAAAAAMATMASCPGSVDTSARVASDPVGYSYWMQANRQHPSPALFLPGILKFTAVPFSRSYRLLARYCCLSVCLFIRLSATMCIVALRVGGCILGVENCTVMFFLVRAQTLSVGCIVWRHYCCRMYCSAKTNREKPYC